MKEYLDKARKPAKTQKERFTVRVEKDLKSQIDKKLLSLRKTSAGKFTLQWFTESALETFLKQLDHL